MKKYAETIQHVLSSSPLTEQITQLNWQRYCVVKTLQIICASAIAREESRGVHYRTDYPMQNSNWQNLKVELNSGGSENVKPVTRQRENHSILH
nr:hypothetical protein [Staphylococcus carnosus]